MKYTAIKYYENLKNKRLSDNSHLCSNVVHIYDHTYNSQFDDYHAYADCFLHVFDEFEIEMQRCDTCESDTNVILQLTYDNEYVADVILYFAMNEELIERIDIYWSYRKSN